MSTVKEIYAETIRPLSTDEKLKIARMIMDEVVPDPVEPNLFDATYEDLKRALPNVHRLVLTDEQLAKIRVDDNE